MNYFVFKNGKGLLIKLIYFRKFHIENIVKATYSIDRQHAFIFGSLYIVILRFKNKHKVTIPFVNERKYEEFISIIESSTKLKVTNEDDNKRKARIKKPAKFSLYVKSSNYNDLFHSILKVADNGRLDSELNDRLPIKIVNSNFNLIRKEPSIHCEGVYNQIWFQYIFTNKGVLFLFDIGENDDKYMIDDYISWNKFNSKDDVYAFVIEAFNFYYDKVNSEVTR